MRLSESPKHDSPCTSWCVHRRHMNRWNISPLRMCSAEIEGGGVPLRHMHPDITCVLTVLIVGATVFGSAEVAHAQGVDSILSRCFPNGTPPIPRLKSARADRAMNTARSSVERFSSRQPLPADVLSRYRKHAAEMCRGPGSVSQSVRGRMHRILRRLRRHAPLSAQRVQITFELAHAAELNAFLGVGGQGCLHDSLFKKLPEDGAIAMIMAHEMGHAIHGHVERKLRLQQAIKHESKAKLKSGYEFAKGKAGEYLRKRGLGTLVEGERHRAQSEEKDRPFPGAKPRGRPSSRWSRDLYHDSGGEAYDDGVRSGGRVRGGPNGPVLDTTRWL